MGENRDIFDGIPKDAVVINTVNLSENTFQEHTSSITNRENWHAFLIRNVRNPERNVILKIVLDHVYPEALLPILFQSKGTDCIFLARNCSGAIKNLLKTKLIIPDPSDKTLKYTFEIILMYSTISKLPLPPNNIVKILEVVFDEKTKTLNLENFSANTELSEFTPLSQPKLLCFVLHLSDEMKPTDIKLKNNEIKTLSPFQIIHGIGVVKKLDLRNNLIEDMEELNNLKIFDLIELWLDGNPVCGKYDSYSYLEEVTKILPSLKKLDGVSIQQQKTHTPQQIYICNSKGFDLAEQFVNHFFSLYDTDRKLLKDLYHESAIFSLTVDDCPGVKESDRLQVYTIFSRNIKHSNSSSDTFAIGTTKVLNILCELPKTKHNIKEFCVDLIHYTDSCAVISVTGTFFQDSKKHSQPDLLSFKRTFTLVKRLFDCVISNELFHIDNSSNLTLSEYSNSKQEAQAAFEGPKMKEMVMAQEAMCRLTGVNKIWAKRLLGDADYNIMQCLSTFVNLLQSNKIPEQAYIENNKHSLMEWLAPKMIDFGLDKFEASLQEEALEYMKTLGSINQNKKLPTPIKRLVDNKIGQKSATFNTGLKNLQQSESQRQSSATAYSKHNLIEINNTYTSTIVQNGGIHDIEMSTSESNDKSTNKHRVDISESQVIKNKVLSGSLSKIVIDVPENNDKENEEICETKIRPLLAFLDKKWIKVQGEYDFQLACNKWILVHKGKDGKFSSKQDDFQKNFTCWKKHFPTYPEENLVHSFHSSCLRTNLKSVFGTIPHPVTFWDFPASVPYDLRPPKYAILGVGGTKQTITRECGYGYLSVRNKWALVTKNKIGLWVLRNNARKVVWKGDGWAVEPLTVEEQAEVAVANVDKELPPQSTDITSKVKYNVTEKGEVSGVNVKELPPKITDITSKVHCDVAVPHLKEEIIKSLNEVVRVEENASEILVCDEDLEVGSDDSDLTERLQLEELKTTYAEDTEPEITITKSNLEFSFLLDNKVKQPKGQASMDLVQNEMINKWQKLLEFVPYVPKLALVEGFWTIVDEKSDLGFHKKNKKWVLLGKNDETNKWSEVNDDFCPDKDSTQEDKLKNLGKNIFDHIPIPVTMYDFPTSVPSKLRPPEKLSDISGKEVHVTPDSGYAFVSIKGQWIAVKQDAQKDWKAVYAKDEAGVKKKVANMPSKNTPVETPPKADDKKSSATCTLLKLIVGCKQLKPITFWDVGGAEEERPPKLALTDINGKECWRCVSPGCGKGFVRADGVWVKVVRSETGTWKATQFSAYQGCIIGYSLIGNIWVTMLKHVIGGKWFPMFDYKTTPSTHWNYIGSDENKPPQQINLGETYKTIHNNSNMGFIMKEGAWILMEKDGDVWKIFGENQKHHIYKLINGIWKKIEEDPKKKWSYKPLAQKVYTYKNFDGLKTYAPPKNVTLLCNGEKIQKIVDEKSGMGFMSQNGVWTLYLLKNGKMIPMKNSQGQTDFGFKRIGQKFVIIRKSEDGKWIEPKNAQLDKVNDVCDRCFNTVNPITYDSIRIQVPEHFKPPRCALIKSLNQNTPNWRLVDETSGYGFVRENDIWFLLRWISKKKWDSTFDDSEYGYKIIDNRWVPVKNENNAWLPVFNPETTPKTGELCVESPEKELPNKLILNLSKFQTKINLTATSSMGFYKNLDEYILVRKMSNEKICFYEESNNVFVFKHKDNKWVMSEKALSSTSIKHESDKIDDIKQIKTYSNAEGNDYERPPRYIKLMESGTLCWKEIKFFEGFGFVKRKYWILVQKIGDLWVVVDRNEGYNIIENRWVLMKYVDKKWEPSFDPAVTPRSSFDIVGDSVLPIRVVTYKGGVAKYVNTANDCSLAFKTEQSDVCILMRQQGGEWIEEKDDFEESNIMAFKLIDCKWRRMKKDAKTNQWLKCNKQYELPVLHIDLVGDTPKPPETLQILGNENREFYMTFNIFSEEGFVLKEDCWFLKKPLKDVWGKYPGIFGTFCYKFIDGKLTVIKVCNGSPETSKNVEGLHLVSDPVNYKDIEQWPNREKPPLDMLILLHREHIIGAKICNCGYRFAKHKDAWVVVKKNKGIWEPHKKLENYYAYKLIHNRWIPMKLLKTGSWEQLFDADTPQTHLDTLGAFEEKPPLRIVMINSGQWKVLLTSELFGFTKKNDMWILMGKSNSTWKQFTFQDNVILGYKLVDGQWTGFTRKLSQEWVRYKKHELPVLSCDFIPGHKKAPPSSLNFGYPSNCASIQSVDVGPLSNKGFIVENGAWILMECKNNHWTRFNRFPTSTDSYGYMFIDGVWKIVIKDIDGSWKPVSFNKIGKRFYEKLPCLPLTKPLCRLELQKRTAELAPPERFIIFEDSKPKLVTLASVERTYGFAKYKGSWVLLHLTKQSKWELAGGLIAYQIVDNRWISMDFFQGGWTQPYDTFNTPITYFEFTKKDRVPLRVALNENGIDTWKVIFQHSGYGFHKDMEKNMWVLMEKQCDGTWQPHLDYSNEFTGYKMIKNVWIKFNKTINGAWTRKREFLPSLPCDFSIFFKSPPPPSLNSIFLKDPRKPREDNDIYLETYTKFGFRKDHDVWVLMECDDSGKWTPHKVLPNQTDLYGYRFNGSCWKILKKFENGEWVEGKLQYATNVGGRFIKDEIVIPVKIAYIKENEKAVSKEVKMEVDEQLEECSNDIEEVTSISPQKDKDTKKSIPQKEIEKQSREKDVEDEVLTDKDVVEKNQQKTGEKSLDEQAMKDKTEFDVKEELEDEKDKESNVESGLKSIDENKENENKALTNGESIENEKNYQNVRNVDIPNSYGQIREKKNGEVIQDRNEASSKEEPVIKDEADSKEQVIKHESTYEEQVIKKENNENGSVNTIKEEKPIQILITNPIQYHQTVDLPLEERPPKSVCLNVRGAPRRIPLVSKASKIGFQHHNGVWVLLERLSGVWRILHNSSGLPLAYKLIDYRWVSMRLDCKGSWVPTFNPSTTPRTYFDTEGPDDSKPPRRIVLEENGILGWKEIGEFCGFGFLKNEDMWILMKKISINNWVVYRDNTGEKCAFKVEDSKWTKFYKREEGEWKIKVEDLPLLHHDFNDLSAAPPVLTYYLQKKTGRNSTDIGFLKHDGAWVLMERSGSSWSAFATDKTIGFVRATGELWNVVEKDKSGQWITVEENRPFESAFDYSFSNRAKRRRESMCAAPNKKVKIGTISSAIDVKRESVDVEKRPSEKDSIDKRDVKVNIPSESKVICSVESTKTATDKRQDLVSAKKKRGRSKSNITSSSELLVKEPISSVLNGESGFNRSFVKSKQVGDNQPVDSARESCSSSKLTIDPQQGEPNAENSVLILEKSEIKITSSESIVNECNRNAVPLVDSINTAVSSREYLSPSKYNTCRKHNELIESSTEVLKCSNILCLSQHRSNSSETKLGEINISNSVEDNADKPAASSKELQENSKHPSEIPTSISAIPSREERNTVPNPLCSSYHTSNSLGDEADQTILNKTTDTEVASNEKQKQVIADHSHNLPNDEVSISAKLPLEEDSRCSELLQSSSNESNRDVEKTNINKIAETELAAKENQQPETVAQPTVIQIEDASISSIQPLEELTKEVISPPVEKIENTPPQSNGRNQGITLIEEGKLFTNQEQNQTNNTNNKPVEMLNTPNSIEDKNKEELNSVELYLAVKPDCCLGCPELQALLRQFRPANNPNKILRKRFRLPDGNFRMLSIPKALTVNKTPVDIQEKSKNQRSLKKRALLSGESVNIKKIKLIDEF